MIPSKKSLLIIPIAIFFLTTCLNKADDAGIGQNHKVYEATYHRNDIGENDAFALFQTNQLTYPLPEASGIVSGRKNPGMVYIHEDSGNRPVVFVYDTLGHFRGEIIFVGTQNRDWEDIAIGPGPVDGESYIYVGDMGDNSSKRGKLQIHRIQEPDLSAHDPETTFSLEIKNEDIFTIAYQYPDGARDAETLMIDPKTRDIIIVTKREVRVHVYKLPYPQSNEDVILAIFKGNLPLRTIVGGDISPNGKEVLLKDYGAIYHWVVQEDIIGTLFHQIPKRVAYVPEVQGEAVGWTWNGNGYFTTTETDNHDAEPILYHYKRN